MTGATVCSITNGGTNTFTVSSVSGGSHELHAALPEFASGGTLTINKGKPITFTLFALPIDIEHLGLKFKLADNSYMSLAFKFKQDLGGGWYPFLACRKYRITNVNTPEEESFTYTIEVFDPETGALIGVTESDRMTLYGHDTVSDGLSVRSYRKSNLHPTTYEPVTWKIQYTTDGTTWTDLPPTGVARPDNATFSITTAPSGSGVDNTTYSTGEVRTANVIGLNPNDQQSEDFGPQIARAHLQNAAPRGVGSGGAGSVATAFDLSKHPVYGNIDGPEGAQNTANSYVISAPGWNKFPLMYGNAITGGADNKSAYWPAAATTTPLALVALFVDILFTTAALFVPRLFVRSIRHEDKSIRDSSWLPNVLVAGTGRDAVRLADDLMLAGSYNVIGFLSEDPDQTGMIIGNLTVYNATCSAEIEALQWRLGGIDAIFFPSGFCHPGKHKQAA